MIGHLGFSYIGLLYLLMISIPNVMWAKRQPNGYDPKGENAILLILERVGQVLVTCCSLIFSDLNLKPFSPWSLWLISSFALMLLYEGFWVRYFRGGHTLKDFYSSFCGVPLPGATLPVIAFFLLGIYGKVIWMMLSIVILGIGHIGIHMRHLKEFKNLTEMKK